MLNPLPFLLHCCNFCRLGRCVCRRNALLLRGLFYQCHFCPFSLGTLPVCLLHCCDACRLGRRV